ncbi:hypothetical protein TruAng_008142 [Truncatella angustata]|nr:hypothetical protein TruAng_008142 [Truncatella angustata]
MACNDAPWLYTDPYAYQHSEISTPVDSLNTQTPRDKNYGNTKATATASSERFELEGTHVQRFCVPQYELEVPGIVAPAQPCLSGHTAELEGNVPSETAQGRAELEGDEIFPVHTSRQQLTSRPALSPIPNPAVDHRPTPKMPHHSLRIMACDEKIVCFPEAQTPMLGSYMPPRPKSALNFDDILRDVERERSKLDLKAWELDRARGRRYLARFDSSN